MDGKRFDQWTRLLTSTAGTRRVALRAAAGGALALLGLARAEARKHKKPKHHKKHHRPPSCRPNGGPCAAVGDCCGTNPVCDGGICRAGPGGACRVKGDCFGSNADCCGGICRVLNGDPANCGACNHQCAAPTDLCADATCCIGSNSVCSLADDRCCGASFCKPTRTPGVGKCCGVSGISVCNADADCCSGDCDTAAARCR